MEKELVILTESDKNGGYCVAGIDIHSGRWIRLVSGDEDTDGALTVNDLTYRNKKMCSVLDIVIVQLVQDCGTSIQPENYLINRKYYLEKTGTYELEDVCKIHAPEEFEYILGKNKGHYVTAECVRNAGGISLVLVRVKDLCIHKEEDKWKADFIYRGVNYKKFSVTEKSIIVEDSFHVISMWKVV